MSGLKMHYYCRCGASLTADIGSPNAPVSEIERAWFDAHPQGVPGHGSVSAKRAAAARRRNEDEQARAASGGDADAR